MIISGRRILPLAIIAVALILMSQIYIVHSAMVPTAKDKTLAFINDVIQPDITKNNVTFINDIVGQSILNPNQNQESVKYHISGSGSGADLICLFTNNVLTQAQLSTIDSSTLSSNFPNDISARALATLSGYQTYTGEDLTSMTKAMTNIDVTRNATTITGNIKLITNNTPFGTDISLKNSYNGTDYTGITFTFRDGQFYSMMDDRSLYTIGNTNVNINQAQAIDIARQYMLNYSYILDSGEVAKAFNVSSIQASTNFYQKDNTTTIYPYWRVQLYLGQTYPGNVYSIEIGIWADSGTVFMAQPIGVGGSFPATTPSQLSPRQTAPSGQTDNSTILISILVGIAVTSIIIGTITVKKRRK